MSHRVGLCLVFAAVAFVASGVASATLLGDYRLDGDTNDYSVNALNGAVSGTATYAAGVYRQAFSFNGTTYIDCGTSATWSWTNQVSVSCWIKLSAWVHPNWDAVVTKGDTSWRLHRSGAGNAINFTVNTNGTTGTVDSTTAVNDNVWHHVVGVYDGTQSQIAIYIDGVRQATGACTGTISTNTSRVLIGENDQALGRQFNGLIDDVQIFNHALTQTQVQGIRGNGTKGYYFATSGAAPAIPAAPAGTRIDQEINDYLITPNPGIGGLGADSFACRWAGTIYVPAAGNWTFYTYSDDGARLWIDSNNDGLLEQVVNQWVDQGPTEVASPILTCTEGVHNILFEYYEDAGGQNAQLRWSGPDRGKQIIPGRAMFQDGTAPTFSNFGAAPTLAKQGTAVTITFKSSENMGANPTVTVNTHAAAFVSVTNNNYTYSYTIQASDADGLAAIAVSGSDWSGNAGSGGNSSLLTVDKTSPTVTLSTTAGAYVNSPTGAILVTIALSEAVTDMALGKISPINAVASGLTTIDAQHYSFTLTPSSQALFSCSIAANAIHDAATNGNTLSNVVSCTWDKTPPTVALSTTAGTYVNTPTGAITVNIVLSEAVTDMALNKISPINAAATGLTSSDATHYSFTLTPSAEGLFSCSIIANAIHDVATNGNTASNTVSCTWDKTGPNATVITATTSSPTNSGTVSFSVTFDESVVNFSSAPDVVVTPSGTVGYSGVNVSGLGASYTVTVSGVTGEGTLRLAAIVGSDVQDLAGNALASSVTSGGVTLDHVRPNALSITPISPNPTNGSTVSFAVHFDEAVQQLNAASDVVVTEAGVSHTGVAFSGGPQDYTVDVTGVTGDGTVRLAVSTGSDVQDLAGNPLNSSVTSALVTVDHTAPRALVVNATTPSPTNGSTVNFTVQFDEAVLNFGSASDVGVTESGTVAHTGVVITGSGTDYTVQVTGVTGDGTLRLAVSLVSDVQDAAANPVASSPTSGAVTVDHTGPGAAGIVAENPNPTNSGTVIYDVTFTEDVQGFNTASDVVVTRTGTVPNPGVTISGSGSSYQVFLTGVTGDGTLRLAVSTSSDVHDVATNALASSVQSAVLTIDHSSPAATAIAPAGPDPTSAASVPFTVTFNESVQSFDALADLVVTETGTVAHTGATITGGPAVYTAAVTGVTGTGTIRIAVSTASDVQDLATNALVSSVTGAAVTVDHVNPAVTVAALTTKDTTPQLSGTVSDNMAVSYVTVLVDGHSYGAAVVGGAWTADVTNALAEGTYDVQAAATDTAGNTAGDATTNELVVDLTPPTVTVTARTTNDTTPQVSGTVNDTVGVASVTVTVDGHGYIATIAGSGWTALVTNALAPGTYDVAAQALDTAGNPGSDATVDELTIDFNVPSVTVDVLRTTDATPAVTGTASAQAGHVINVVNVTVNGVIYLYTPAPPANTVAWSITTGTLPDGTYDVLAEATDDLARTGSDGTVDELTVDTQPPTATLSRVAASETGADSVAFTVTFSEPVTPTFDGSDVTVVGTLGGAAVVTGSDPAYTVTVALADPDADGTVGIAVGTGVTDLVGHAYAGATSPMYNIFNWRGFTAQPQGAQAYDGDAHTFSVTPDCQATTIAYQWQWDDGLKVVHDGPAARTWPLTGLSAAHRGTYWCEVSYDGVVHETTHATLAVEPHLQITSQPVGADKQPGDTYTFSVVASGGYAPLGYQWKKDGTTIPNATNASYTRAGLSAGDTGYYSVDVTDANSDAQTSDAALLTVGGAGLPVAAGAGLALLLTVLAATGASRARQR